MFKGAYMKNRQTGKYEGFVYKVTCEETDKIYIGQTLNLQSRWWDHKSSATHQRRASNPLYQDMEKFGISCFSMTLLEKFEADSIKELNNLLKSAEEEYIKKYDTLAPKGYNLCLGRSPGPLTRARLSDAFSGSNHPNYGKPMSDDQKEKLRIANTGKTLSEETKDKLRVRFSGEKNPFYGKKHSDETIKKLSEQAKGKYMGAKSPRARAVRNITTNEIFGSLSDASRCYNLSASNISAVCSGKLQTCGGFRWEYAD
jgi:group I intron endonuclease